jgi:phospholipid/cholesterol/gamma-HCH transport system ATP-binding protein
VVEFRNVTFCRGERAILDELSFRAGFSERVAILGESGSGKTTILKLIMGLLQPDEGAIVVDGLDIANIDESELRDTRLRFSIVFQDGALFDSMTVKENVAFYMREYGSYTEEHIDRAVRDQLDKVGVHDAVRLMPEELSGGMQRRVAIARSLAAREPDMFLYDEPTSDLDPLSSSTILKLIRALSSSGRGFLMVTHQLADASKVADRFLFLHQGKILFDGDRRHFFESDQDIIQRYVKESTAETGRRD